ncbi:MAG TPA: hypothetical protein VGV08_11360, partial [Casimicrobiaceae bacterium]|nr:hypothetical protein [Casimicrobiaceae bacterium]
MAKLAELKSLIQAARARDGDDPARKGAPARPAAPRRRVAAAKHADRDIDIADAFADVTPLRASNSIARSGERPAPIPRQRIEDERDALELSKYGAEPSPQS